MTHADQFIASVVLQLEEVIVTYYKNIDMFM